MGCCNRNDYDYRTVIRFFSLVTLILLLPAVLFAPLPVWAGGSEILHFPDQHLEDAVRDALNKPAGIITAGDMRRLTELEGARREIHNLEGLEHAVNLTVLNLYENGIEDIAPLKGLNRLRELYLGGNNIIDIGPLQSLSNLHVLNINSNKVRDLSPLASLGRLHTLSLDGNPARDLAPLGKLGNLTHLHLGGSFFQNTGVLAGMRRLQELYLVEGQVADVTFLANLTNLRRLALDGNSVEDILPLQNLKGLQWLSLSNNRIVELVPLQSLRRLEFLDLENNRIRELSPLETLLQLKWLELRNNYLDLADGAAAKEVLLTLEGEGVAVNYEPQKVPLFGGNGLVFAKAGSGGSLLFTAPENRFTIYNHTKGWRIKSFSVAHEGGKPLDSIPYVGRYDLGTGGFAWHHVSGGNLTVTFQKPQAIQLGIGVQIQPGYAGDPARSFYLSEVNLVNLSDGDYYTVSLDIEDTQNMPVPGGAPPRYLTGEAKAASYAELHQEIAAALQNRMGELMLTYTGPELDPERDLEQIISFVLQEDDYLKYSIRSRSIEWSRLGNALNFHLRFIYLATREEEGVVEREVARILRTITRTTMNQHEITKAVHDYVVANVRYDTGYREYSAYAALIKGKAVCQGYALLMQKMLAEAGIETRIITGSAGGELHAWNLVRLAGNWYHLDATWNDPVPDVPGRVLYDYYLRIDREMDPTHRWERSDYPVSNVPYTRNFL